VIKIGDLLDLMPVFLEALTWPVILAKADDIVRTGERGNRTEAQHRTDAIKGLALEVAVWEYLERHGYTVSAAPENDKTFDLFVEGNGLRYKVDVKGKWNRPHFEPTKWEMSNAGPDVLYFCVDVFPDRFIHRGQCFFKNLEPGFTKPVPYVKVFSEVL
jgi:hypothetical protein